MGEFASAVAGGGGIMVTDVGVSPGTLEQIVRRKKVGYIGTIDRNPLQQGIILFKLKKSFSLSSEVGIDF